MSLFDTDLVDTPERLILDIGALAEIKGLLEPGSEAWRRAQVFVGFYQSLDKAMQGHAVAMCHWLRRHKEALGKAPFYLIVDEGRLEEVLKYLQERE